MNRQESLFGIKIGSLYHRSRKRISFYPASLSLEPQMKATKLSAIANDNKTKQKKGSVTVSTQKLFFLRRQQRKTGFLKL